MTEICVYFLVNCAPMLQREWNLKENRTLINIIKGRCLGYCSAYSLNISSGPWVSGKQLICILSCYNNSEISGNQGDDFSKQPRLLGDRHVAKRLLMFVITTKIIFCKKDHDSFHRHRTGASYFSITQISLWVGGNQEISHVCYNAIH